MWIGTILSLAVSVALYVIACLLPALELRKGGTEVMTGASTLALGWLGVFAGVFGWCANPLWVAGWVLLFLRKPWQAAITGLLAVGIALTTMTILGRELPGDEGNVTKMSVVRLLPGFYVWVASLTPLPIAALLVRLRT